MSQLHRITARPDQCGGRPCILDMRIRVKDILEMLASGATREEILADFPYPEPEDIAAALEFAAAHSEEGAWAEFRLVLPQPLTAPPAMPG
jgi:uncharacterized protein (DUF433 family)